MDPALSHGELFDQHCSLIPDTKFRFMNFGYVDQNYDKDKNYFSWLETEYSAQKYAANLVRTLTEKQDLNNKSILDIGCGRGGACDYLSKQARPKRIVGLDYSRKQVEFCQKNYSHENLNFVHGDACNLPFADTSFDLVINIESSACYASLDTFFSEVFRVLAPGGTFCYTDMLYSNKIQDGNRKDDFFDWGGMLLPRNVENRDQVLLRNGFHLVEKREISNEVLLSLNDSVTDLKGFWQSSAAPNAEGKKFVEFFFNTCDQVVAKGLRSGELSYWIWRLQKPDT